MFRMTPHGHRLSNGGLTDSHLPLDVPGGSLDLGYLRACAQCAQSTYQGFNTDDLMRPHRSKHAII